MLALLLPISGELRAVSPEDIRLPEDLMYVFEQAPIYGSKDEVAIFWNKNKKQILETPDITDRLYDLLWPTVEAGRLDLFQMIIRAFAIRGDLSSEQLTRITDKLREKATPEIAKSSSSDCWFVESVASMLGAYPSAEHEEILLSLLKLGNDGWSRAAGISLGKIGTRRSLSSLRELAATRKAEVDPEMRDAMIARYGKPGTDSIAEALDNLQRRLNTSERRSSREAGLYQKDYEFKSRSTDPANSESYRFRNSSIAAMILSLVIIATAVWRFLKVRAV